MVAIPNNEVKTQIQFEIFCSPQAVLGHVVDKIGDAIILWYLAC